MLPGRLMRLAGLAALISGVLSGVGDLLSLAVDLESPQAAATAAYAVVFGLYLLGTMLLLLGLVGLYASQSEAAGTLGLVSFLVAFAGTTLVGGAVWFELFISPTLAARAPELATAELGLVGFLLTFVLAAVGWLLFGAAALRAGVYPRPAAVLLMVGAVVSLAPIIAPVPLSGIALSVAVAWLGFVLFSGTRAASGEPSRLSQVRGVDG